VSQKSIRVIPEDIRSDATVHRLLERMPESVRDSFNDEQLMHIRNAIGARNWGNHSIDKRGVLALPMFSWRYYYVFLAGRNRRNLNSTEKNISRWLGSLLLASVTALVILFILLVLYLLKSAAGVDLFPGFSLGIWTWYKSVF
jgi:hypothetical protein